MNGKPGTLSVDDFETLESIASTYGETGVAHKVAKSCKNKALKLFHEFKGSTVAKAYEATSSKILTSLNGVATVVKNSDFAAISGLVDSYGPELIVNKLAKIAKKNGKNDVSGSLKKIFPLT